MDKSIKLLAKLTNVPADEITSVGYGFVQGGFSHLAVSLNSTNPFECLKNLQEKLNHRVHIGAVDVEKCEQVCKVARLGGTFIITSQVNLEIISLAKNKDLECYVGVSSIEYVKKLKNVCIDGIHLPNSPNINATYVNCLKKELNSGVQIYVFDLNCKWDMSRFYDLGIKGYGFDSKKVLEYANWGNSKTFAHNVFEKFQDLGKINLSKINSY